MRSTIYLAGPMTEDDDWRAPIKDTLEVQGFRVRTPEFLERYVELFGVSTEEAAAILTARDRVFSSESDYVLVNFTGSTARSMGTCVELGWADNGKTVTIAVNPDGQPHFGHPIVENACDFVTDTVEEALNILYALTWYNG